MNRILAMIGLAVAVVGAALFYGVFAGFLETSMAMSLLAALVLLPVGSGVMFFGAAYRGSYSVPAVAPSAAPSGGRSGAVWAALAVAIIAIILGVAAISIAYGAQSTANSANGSISSVTSEVSGLNATLSSSGIQPTSVALKVDWCNTDNTGQDRYCPSQLVVNQGDTVQILFIHNDTDAHTFTLDTSPYFFQINDTAAGMHNFLTNDFIANSCSNTGSYADDSASISGTYCVSGSSLLAPSGNFRIAQNSNPSVSPAVLDILPIDNQVHIINFNATSGASEVWGIGAFQATTPGIYEFFCHYHVSNGMFGYLIVLPNAYCTSNPSSCGLSST